MFKELNTPIEKEYKFCPTRRWKADFCLTEHKIIIEQEGGIWSGGRHTNPSGFIGDMEKYNEAVALGFVVLRFSPQDLRHNYAKCLELIKRTIKIRETK